MIISPIIQIAQHGARKFMRWFETTLELWVKVIHMANIFKRKTKKLVDLHLKEISGVDHPASLHEGWAVMKSSDNDLEQALGDVVIDSTTNEPMEKNVETETTEIQPEDNVAEPAAVVTTDIEKALDDVRKELAEQKEMNSNLVESIEMQKAVSDAQRWNIIPELEPTEFAPVLRSLRAVDSEASDKLETVLDAVAVALGEAGILKEVGSDGAPDAEDAYGQIEQIAKGLVEEGKASSLADGIAQTATNHPDLYSAYVAEQRGA